MKVIVLKKKFASRVPSSQMKVIVLKKLFRITSSKLPDKKDFTKKTFQGHEFPAPRRTSFGQQGRPIMLKSNHLEVSYLINDHPTQLICQYTSTKDIALSFVG